MRFDYRANDFGRACLAEATKSKSTIGFGAVLVKDGKIIGRGWNRHSVPKERRLLSHVDYAIHAEQACIADALLQNIDISDSAIYVLGIVLTGSRKDELTTRSHKVFICKKCPPTLLRFDIPVHIPHMNGWVLLTPQQAERTAKKMCGNGYWKKFQNQK